MTMTDHIEQRLDRLETKLDKLVELTGDIRVLRGQMAQQSESLARAFARIEEHDKRIDSMQVESETAIHDLTLHASKADIKLGFGERVWWMIASAVVGLAVYFFQSGDL